MIVTDACPWGIGAVLVHLRLQQPVAWFSKKLLPREMELLGLEYGSSASQGPCEVIALIVAVRIWTRFLTGTRSSVRARTDSTTALSIISRYSSSSCVLNFLGANLAISLEAADLDLIGEHILGKWNTVADALSRRFVPSQVTPWSVPPSLNDAKEMTNTPEMDETFWFLPCPGNHLNLWAGSSAVAARFSCFESLWSSCS